MRAPLRGLAWATMLTTIASCKQDPATSSSNVTGLANPKPSPSGTPPATAAAAAPPAPPPAAALTMTVNGLALAPRTALASTRGGEVIHVELSTIAGRTCDDLFGHDGISLGADEVLVSLDLARPIAGDRDATGRTPPPGSLPMQVTHASWPSGQDGLQRLLRRRRRSEGHARARRRRRGHLVRRSRTDAGPAAPADHRHERLAHPADPRRAHHPR
ncbi:MAG: hypothetical protein K8W52_19325 [Deltaproteobacteria bacterium]|nr:hypothetical protein [Deltaproteobacteria bacterium]